MVVFFFNYNIIKNKHNNKYIFFKRIFINQHLSREFQQLADGYDKKKRYVRYKVTISHYLVTISNYLNLNKVTTRLFTGLKQKFINSMVYRWNSIVFCIIN